MTDSEMANQIANIKILLDAVKNHMFMSEGILHHLLDSKLDVSSLPPDGQAAVAREQATIAQVSRDGLAALDGLYKLFGHAFTVAKENAN